MKYAFKILRCVATGEITFSEILRVPDDTEPYSFKRINGHRYYESMRILDSREEAAAAIEEEKYAASLYRLTKEERLQLREDTMRILRETGLTVSAICRVTGTPTIGLVRAQNRFNPNPRVLARLQICAGILRETIERMKNVLPLDSGPGFPWRNTVAVRKRNAAMRAAENQQTDPAE